MNESSMRVSEQEATIGTSSKAEITAPPPDTNLQPSSVRTTDGDPTADALYEVAGKFSAGSPAPVEITAPPTEVATPKPPAEVQDFLQKVQGAETQDKNKTATGFSKGADSQGWADPEKPDAYLNASIIDAKKDLGDMPAKDNLEKYEAVNATEKGFGETGIYAMSGPELRRQLQEIKGIGPKLSERIAGTLEDFKEIRATFPLETRNQQFAMESAADLMIIPQVGIKRSNAIAEKFGLELAENVSPAEPDDYEFDEEQAPHSLNSVGYSMEPGTAGFQPEDESSWQNNTKTIAESDQNPPGWDDRDEAGDAEYGNLPEYHHQDDITKRIGQALQKKETLTMKDLLNKMGMTEEEAKEKVRAAMNAGDTSEARRVADMYAKQKADELLESMQAEQAQSSGQPRSEKYVAPQTIDLPKDQYTVGEGTPITDESQQETNKSIFTRFRESLQNAKLSEAKKKLLTKVALAAAAATTAVLLTFSSMQVESPRVTQVMDTVAQYVQKTEVPETLTPPTVSAQEVQQQFNDSNPELVKPTTPIDVQSERKTTAVSWLDRVLGRDKKQAEDQKPATIAGVGIPTNSIGGRGYLGMPTAEQAQVSKDSEQTQQTPGIEQSQTIGAETAKIDKDSLWNEIEVVVRNSGQEPDNASTDVVKDLIKAMNNGRVDFSQDVSDKQFSVLTNSAELGQTLPGADGQTLSDEAILRVVKLVKDMNSGVDLPADASEEILGIIKKLSSGELFSEDISQEDLTLLVKYALNELAQ